MIDAATRGLAPARRDFGRWLASKRVICLDVPDEYEFMDPGLVSLLEAKVGRHLRLG